MKNKGLKRTAPARCLGAVLTALVIVLVIALNLLLTYFGGVGLWLADMTPEGLYTVSDDMKKYTSFINELENVMSGSHNKPIFISWFSQACNNIIFFNK